MTADPAAQFQKTNDAVMDAMTHHYFYPALLAAVGLGLLVLALEAVKVIIRKLVRGPRKPSGRSR